jgi:circadian clock protein KaiB
MKKKNDKSLSTKAVLEEKAKNLDKQKYVLRLYVAGMTAKSSAAIEAITRICEENLKGRYDLEIIDIYQNPALAKDEQIIAAPTLIKKLPKPLRKFIGNIDQEEKMLVGLDLVPRAKK